MFFWRKSSKAKLVAEHLRKEYERTDFGRRYGWWLRWERRRIADLNYWRWDSDSQFWHEYRVFAFDSAFDEIGFEPDRWCQADISLESRYVEGYYATGILMARRPDQLVAIRSVHVPEAEFMRVARENFPTI